jgi:glucose/arabinose dehydrogenase
MSKFVAVAILLAILFLSACSDDNTAEPPATTATPSASGNGVPSGTGAPATGLPSQVKLQRVFPSLGFDNMTGMYPLPGGGWLVTEQAGRVQMVNAAGTQASTLLDVRSLVNSGGEEGLLGLAVSPDFASTGTFYVYYSAANPRRSVITRYSSSSGVGAPGSAQVILEVAQPFSNHNGGQMVFGPDGYLYIGLGDGGSRLDPQGNGQNAGTLLGSILRIDVRGSGAAYRVPVDNPFVGQQGARGEIWAYGLRNPWRFSFDSETGDLWVGDVGQNTLEEVDVVTKGGNYGWNVMEGSQCLGGGSCDRSGKVPPIVDYPTGGGNCAVTGGFVYHGDAVPALRGAYVYGDYCSGRIWALRWDGTQMTENAQLASAGFGISSFAQGRNGEIYALEYGDDGGVYQIRE